MNRRDFVRLMGLAGGASALSSCNLERQAEKIIPYLVPPDDGVIPGVAVYNNTTCTECPAGCGASTRVVDYHAGKLEGVTSHPINDGALCMRGQASLSRLHHPDRLKTPLRKDEQGEFSEISWDEAYELIATGLQPTSTQGFDRKSPASTTGDVFLSGRTTGTLSDLIDRFCAGTGVERLPEFEMCSYEALRGANKILFGLEEIPSYRIDEADFLLTVGADLLETFVSPVSHAVQFGRAKANPDFEWTHVEPHASLTGFQAKHRLTVTPGSEPYLLSFLLRKVSRVNVAGDRHIADLVEALPKLSDRGFAEKTGLTVEQLNDIATQMLSADKPLVIAGGASTMQAVGFETALLTGLLQWATGMTSATVDFDSAEDYTHVGTAADLQALSARLENGTIGVLFVSGVDAAAGGNTSFGLEHIDKAKLSVGLTEFMNHTVEQCDLVLPLSNTLESWGDVTPRRDLVGVIQPAVEPLYDTRTTGDILLQLLQHRSGDAVGSTYQEFLFDRWTNRYGESAVDRLLTDGFLRLSASPRTVSLDRSATVEQLRNLIITDSVAWPVLMVTPSIRAFDGRSGDLALLNEIPDPLTTISWGAWISMSQADATALEVREKDEVNVSLPEWKTELPVKIQNGLPKGVMTIQLGSVKPAPIAVDPRSGGVIASFEGITIRRTERALSLPILSGSLSQEGRGVIPRASHGEDEHHHDTEATLYPDNEYPEYRWGMAVDLDLCIGCGACASACYVENNVPIVGPEQHLLGREMSWIRIEPYDDGDSVEFQPMMCQHCANAPCESVCPVYATYHNPEGLNAQVYNRCVGTRYCANNCPYKVRRFNWFDNERPSALNATLNPEVPPRSRGVMEKCTFCVQRIRSARDAAKDDKRQIAEGEVTTACAQTCPTRAIVFGDLQDRDSEVRKWAESDRSYRVFESLGTAPGVHYLSGKWKKGHA